MCVCKFYQNQYSDNNCKKGEKCYIQDYKGYNFNDLGFLEFKYAHSLHWLLGLIRLMIFVLRD